MITKEQQERLLNNLSEKGLNKATKNYILKYANKNSELFSNYIDMDKLIDRLSTNINKNISYNMGIINSFLKNGFYLSNKGAIKINPILLFNKKQRESTILHEIDHAATTTDADNPIEYAKECLEEKIKNQPHKSKFFMKMLKETNIDKLAEGYLKFVGSKIVGIRGAKNRALNEGITRYKELKYMGERLGNGYQTFFGDSYGPECKIASEISKIIGEDNLIKFSFNNDFEGMCKLFSDRTDGKGNLEEISNKLEETHSRKRHLRPIKFIKNYSNISRQLKECKKIATEKDYNTLTSDNKRNLGEQLQQMVNDGIKIEDCNKTLINQEKTLAEKKQTSKEMVR